MFFFHWGVHGEYVSMEKLLRADIILCSYNTLRRDIYHADEVGLVSWDTQNILQKEIENHDFLQNVVIIDL